MTVALCPRQSIYFICINTFSGRKYWYSILVEKKIILVGEGGIILYAVCSLQSNLTTVSDTGTLILWCRYADAGYESGSAGETLHPGCHLYLHSVQY